MKIWEVIKELTENPNKKFVSTIDSSRPDKKRTIICEGTVVRMVNDNTLYTTDEWEEIKEPVDFMTAFKTWHDDQRTIRHEREYESEIITITKFDGKNEYANFGAGLILSGKWYIED